MTTRKVPKYRTPMGVSVALMAKPTRQKRSPARIEGERFWWMSDHLDHATTAAAAGGGESPSKRTQDNEQMGSLPTMYGGTERS